MEGGCAGVAVCLLPGLTTQCLLGDQWHCPQHQRVQMALWLSEVPAQLWKCQTGEKSTARKFQAFISKRPGDWMKGWVL